MNRGKKAAYNSLASLFAQIISIICGFILPRLILKNFGSSYNGLIQSVTQYLTIIVLLRAGVGGATRAALYKTLADKDDKQLSATIRATELFMRKIARIFIVLVLLFSCLYPLIVKYDFEWLFSASLVLIISISTFVEYYFGITYHILLQADQKQYISSILSVVTIIVNTILSVLLINGGFGIHIVKLGSAVAYCINPIAVYLYSTKHYHIDKTVKPDFSSINQRWDALFHQLAGYIYTNTDIMLITVFLNLKQVSVYTTYCLVANGLRTFMSTVTAGVEAAFGDMLARGDKNILITNIKIYETILHGVLCILFGTALILVTPFIEIYTKGVNDVSYSRHIFGYVLIISQAIHLVRQPYQSIVEASGHFKQTKYIPAIQAVLNLVISIALINIWGLIGVIIGTIISDVYCGIAYRFYVKKSILQNISIAECLKRIIVTTLTMLTIFFVSRLYIPTNINDYLEWIVCAIPTTLTSMLITLVIGFLFYHETLRQAYERLKSIMRSILRRA